MSDASPKKRRSNAKRNSKKTSGGDTSVTTAQSSKQGTTTSEGSGSGSKKSSNAYDSGYSKSNSYEYAGYGNTQRSLKLEEINRPPVYKRIACIRYVRPMMAYDACWGGGSQCGPGYPYCYDPYYCGYPGQGECFNSTRAFIVPPRSKALYRPARDEDLNVSIKTVDECPSFLKIRGECDRGEGPKTPPSPPPPPPPPPKPKPDRTKLLKKYLHESKPKRKKKERKKTPPPPKKKTPPPKKKHSPPPKEKKPPPPPPPKEEKKPPPPPPPPKSPPPPPPPKVERKPPPPPPPRRPPPPPPEEDSSKSSVNSAQNEFKTTQDGRELHHQADVVRRTSSFEAINHAASQVKTSTQIEPIAPQRRRNKY